jgi:CBS-domain-containing membrane protein
MQMAKEYKELSVQLLPRSAHYVTPGQSLPEHVTQDSPAIDVMTDLSRVMAVTIEPNASIDLAEKRMRSAGVRLLLVVNKSREILGLITLTDIIGERPLRFQKEVGVNHEDVLVRDVMTPCEKLEVISRADVARSRVGDIVMTMKRHGRQHALVAETTDKGMAVCGIFSATRIGRQLGIPVDTTGVAGTFAELESALTH